MKEGSGARFLIFQSRPEARAWRSAVFGDGRLLKDFKPHPIGPPICRSASRRTSVARLVDRLHGIDTSQNTATVLGVMTMHVADAIAREKPHLERLWLPVFVRAIRIEDEL